MASIGKLRARAVKAVGEGKPQGFDILLNLTGAQLESQATNAVTGMAAEIGRLRAQGVDTDTIRRRIISDVESGAGNAAGLNAVVNNTAKEIQQSAFIQGNQEALLGDEDPNEAMFMWYAIGSNTCEDCLARHGRVLPYSEWVVIGLPRTGTTVCRVHCRCSLVPLDKARKLYGGTTTDELTTNARQQIKDRNAEIKAQIRERGEPYARSTYMAKLGNFGEGPGVTNERRLIEVMNNLIE